jgi:hypothetical protein
MRLASVVGLIGISLAAGAAPVVGQEIRGTLVDESDQPVSGASVSLIDATGAASSSTLTSESGTWRLRASVLGASYTLRVQKVGYAIVETMPFVAGTSPVVANLRTRAQVTTLQGVSVEALNLAGFLSREERRMGQLLTPDEVARRMEKIRPADVSRFLTALVPGLEVSPRGAISLPRRAAGRGCYPTIVVDRKRYDPPRRTPAGPIGPGSDIEDLVSLEDLAAVEIYGDASFVPLELGLLNLEPVWNPCGVIVIWTKRGFGSN